MKPEKILLPLDIRQAECHVIFLRCEIESKHMKTLLNNIKAPDFSRQAELCHCILDSLVQVKNCARSVVVKVTRDDFPGLAKTFFIRQLASAGFIPDRYRCYSEGAACAALEVEWVSEGVWIRAAHRISRFARHVLDHVTSVRLL